MNKRIETLDWLRGLTALSIMFYHLTYFIVYPINASNPLGRLGIYGVSIFFILSGLSIAIVYNKYIKNIGTSINFFIRRLFRIWPLFWIICLLYILPDLISSDRFDYLKLFLNLTTLFGFFKPTNYIAAGAWSIGNEMVYYSLTPLIFFLYNYKIWIGNCFLILCCSVGIFFAFYLLDPKINLAYQWEYYVNPFNNLFLYVLGIFIFYHQQYFEFNSKLNNILLILAILLFCFLPYKGDNISIVTGFGRIVFVMLSLIIVLCFFKLKITLPIILTRILSTLGIATYGVYLFHPIIYYYLNHLSYKTNFDQPFFLFSIVSLVTIIISYYFYNFFELKLIRMGKRWTSKK